MRRFTTLRQRGTRRIMPSPPTLPLGLLVSDPSRQVGAGSDRSAVARSAGEQEWIDKHMARARELAIESANSPSLRLLRTPRLPRVVRRLRWWRITRGCECHWQEPYGEVVMGGCPLHD